MRDITPCYDQCQFFFNPFRRVWAFSIRENSCKREPLWAAPFAAGGAPLHCGCAPQCASLSNNPPPSSPIAAAARRPGWL